MTVSRPHTRGTDARRDMRVLGATAGALLTAMLLAGIGLATEEVTHHGVVRYIGFGTYMLIWLSCSGLGILLGMAATQ